MPTDVGMPCDICSARVRVLRFNLTRTYQNGERHTTRGSGSMYLCQGCWETFARPRMRRVREKAEKAKDWTAP